MGKQYELLAVEPDLRQKATAELKRLRKLFATGSFTGQLIHYEEIIEGELEIPEERVELVTTVTKELDQLENILGKYIDASIQKEMTNSQAEATVSVDGLEFTLSATALLNLESKLEDLKDVYEGIPTLDPTQVWHYDDAQDTYVSETRAAYRYKKVPKSFVAYEATKEHPAQVEVFNEDIPTHKRETIVYSGAISVAEKREKLARIDELLTAVKQARQRANDIEASDIKIADEIFAWINK